MAFAVVALACVSCTKDPQLELDSTCTTERPKDQHDEQALECFDAYVKHFLSKPGFDPDANEAGRDARATFLHGANQGCGRSQNTDSCKQLCTKIKDSQPQYPKLTSPEFCRTS